MRHIFGRTIVVGVGAVAIGALAVACTGAPRVDSTMGGFKASMGNFSLVIPGVAIPLISNPQNPSTATVDRKDALIGAVHSGEGCPIALPQ